MHPARMVLTDAILGASGTVCPATWRMLLPGLNIKSRFLLAG